MNRTRTVNVRFTQEEYSHIKSMIEANSGTMSEFIRTCVNNALAQAGDPKGVEMLVSMFEKGISQYLRRKERRERGTKK